MTGVVQVELKVTVTIRKEGNYFVAECEEYNLTAENFTIEEALADLQKKIHKYLEDEQLSVSTSLTFIIKMPVQI